MSDNWSMFEDQASEWDNLLTKLGQTCVFQSSNWARHKSLSGWTPIRIVKSSFSSVIAIQCLVRRGPFGTALVWAPGGFGGDLTLIDKAFIHCLKQFLNVRFLYFRFGMMVESTPAQTSLLMKAGFRESKIAIGAKQSLLLGLQPDEKAMLSRASRNWKRNYKRSLRMPISPYIWRNANPDQLETAYRLMNDYKKIDGVSLQMSAPDFQSIQKCFSRDLVLIRMDDEAGKLLSVRGALIQHSIAWDLIAVTTPDGRKTYSSHRTLLALAIECARRGCRTLELGGIDPENNKGVFDFKNGTGAQSITYLGEWEGSVPSGFNRLVSMVLARWIQK